MAKKIIRLTESDLIALVRRIVKEQEVDFDDTPIEDEPSFDDEEDEDNIEDLGFDVDDDMGIDDEFQNKMKSKESFSKNRPSGLNIGGGTRWDKDSEKEYNPIKPDDLPLDKFLKSKYNKFK